MNEKKYNTQKERRKGEVLKIATEKQQRNTERVEREK